MKKLHEIRVGGVPEHFNYPFKIGLERGFFLNHGIQLEWTDIGKGTGAMISALKDGEQDVIVALTEGLVADIVKGSNLRLFGTYVKSPLRWAVIVGKNSPYQTVEDLKGKKFAISRYQSGSHLMACALALERGWHPQKELSFEVVGAFQELRNSINDGSTDAFLWEHFTTKPFVDSGEVRVIGEITTPWSCFMLASTEEYIKNNIQTLQLFLKGLNEACVLFQESPSMPNTISEVYGLQLEDAKSWYRAVSITASSGIAESSLTRAVNILYQTKTISSNDFPIESLISPELSEVETDIKHMKLYNKPELLKFLRNSLISIGKANGPLNFMDLTPFDQNHYFGTQAIDEISKEVGFEKGKLICNIGSGLGGPARYISGKYGSQVLAIELQDDLNRTASELTTRCNLQNLTHHVSGDFLQVGQYLQKQSFDSIVSWITVLHIQNREKLFQLSFDLLKPGGIFFAEDFFKISMFSNNEILTLQQEVSCPYVPDLITYKGQLTKAGFEIIKIEDKTNDWKEFTKDRVNQFKKNSENLLSIHRKNTYERLLSFFETVSNLFQGGNLGGARFIVRKPL